MSSANTVRLSNKDVFRLRKFKDNIVETNNQMIRNQILNKQQNKLDFYVISPRDDPTTRFYNPKTDTTSKDRTIISQHQPKNKNHFQRITKKQEKKVRPLLREQGEIMTLQEVYHCLDRSDRNIEINNTALEKIVNLDRWEKNKIHQRMTFNSKRSEKQEKMPFSEGIDYSVEVEKRLEIVAMTHSSERKILEKFALIEMSSKQLKNELNQKKKKTEEVIAIQVNALKSARAQHHLLFQEKIKLNEEMRQGFNETVHDFASTLPTNFSFRSKTQKAEDLKNHHKGETIENQTRIYRIKFSIQQIEKELTLYEQEHKNIVEAERKYYQVSLQHGVDCRDTGLVWILKSLKIEEKNMQEIEFPTYIDKKTKMFLITKCKFQQALDQLLEEKKKLISTIGKKKINKRSRENVSFRVPQIDKTSRVGQEPTVIPKKYQQSLRKMSVLQQEFFRNLTLLDLNKPSKVKLELAGDIEGITGRQIYNLATQKIRKLDFSKLKKEKGCQRKSQLNQYQCLLESISAVHIKIEEEDMQEENHILTHYGEQKQQFFMVSAACFGVKKAYAMIIKHFPWDSEELDLDL